jgi:hypothetical protein
LIIEENEAQRKHASAPAVASTAKSFSVLNDGATKPKIIVSSSPLVDNIAMLMALATSN